MIIKKFFILIIFTLSFETIPRSHGFRIFTIMLDPAGNARETGRIIEDSLERAITIQFVQKLQEEIESYLPNSNVIITRTPGEMVYPLQNANFSNRLPVDLYININIALKKNEKPSLFLYQFSLGDTFVSRSYDLSMIPFDKAHQQTAQQSTIYAQQIKKSLATKEFKQLFLVHGPYQLPFTPLVGIQAAALGLEVIVANKNEWKKFIQPLAQSIATTLE